MPMLQSKIKIISSIVFLFVMFATASCSSIKNKPDKSETPTFIPEALLNEKIKYYRDLYPEIGFLILQGGDELRNDMLALDLLLGDQARSLDYEHLPKSREDLMFVSAERILFMLQYKLPSAALFKADTPPGWQEHICVLTINPNEVAANSNVATGHLLDLPQAVLQKISQDMKLPADDYLAFVIDHEVYHCLKSMYVGPQLMSHKDLWAEYNQFHEEQGADAYALAMHIKTRNEISSFAKNIIRIRGMSLYNADPDHLTCKALEQVIKVPLEDITTLSTKEVFDLVISIKGKLTISYDEYVQQLASAIWAIKEIGVGELVSDELIHKLKEIQVDPIQVKAFVESSRRCYVELCTDELDCNNQTF